MVTALIGKLKSHGGPFNTEEGIDEFLKIQEGNITALIETKTDQLKQIKSQHQDKRPAIQKKMERINESIDEIHDDIIASHNNGQNTHALFASARYL